LSLAVTAQHRILEPPQPPAVLGLRPAVLVPRAFWRGTEAAPARAGVV